MRVGSAASFLLVCLQCCAGALVIPFAHRSTITRRAAAVRLSTDDDGYEAKSPLIRALGTLLPSKDGAAASANICRSSPSRRCAAMREGTQLSTPSMSRKRYDGASGSDAADAAVRGFLDGGASKHI